MSLPVTISSKQIGTANDRHAWPGERAAPVRTVVHCGLEDTDLRGDWEALGRVAPRGGLFTTHEWCRAWSQTVGRDCRPMILQVMRGSQTIGLAPLCLRRGRGANWLEMLGQRRVAGDHMNWLSAPGQDEDCFDAVCTHLADHVPEIDGLALAELDADSPMLARLRHWGDARGFSIMQRPTHQVPRIRLPESFDEFLATRSSNMRYHIRRRCRAVSRMAAAGIRLVRTEGEVAGLLPIFFQLHAKRWRRVGVRGSFEDNAMQAFLTAFCRSAAQRGWLRCYVLEESCRVVAVLIAFHCQGTASFYQLGWSDDGPVQSPGVVLLAASIRQAINERMSCYDFLQGRERYKERWTDESVGQTSLLVGMRVPARVIIAAERIKRSVKTVVLYGLGRSRLQDAVHRKGM